MLTADMGRGGRRGAIAAVAGIGLIATMAAGCGSSGGAASPKQSGSGTPQADASGHAAVQCPSPAAAPAPSWPPQLPADLPKPSPATIVKAFDRGRGVQQAQFVVPRSLRDEVIFVLHQLPAAGYRLGDGDAERTEADTPFARGGTHGLIRLSALGPCRTEWTVVTVARGASPSGPLLPSHDEPSGSDQSGDRSGNQGGDTEQPLVPAHTVDGSPAN